MGEGRGGYETRGQHKNRKVRNMIKYFLLSVAHFGGTRSFVLGRDFPRVEQAERVVCFNL